MLRVRIMLVLFSSLVPMLMLVGCSGGHNSVDTSAGTDPLEIPQNDLIARRFQESAPQAPTAVESALELSDKYARLSDEAASLRQQNQEIGARNQQLEAQAAVLSSQLQQAQKELAQANELLIEMRIELNNWKSDILGFREEMRNAETAQLETLFKILKVLGGQVDTAASGSQNAGAVGSAAASSSRSYNP